MAFVEGEVGGTSAVEQYQARWRASIEDLDERPAVLYNADAEFGEDKRLISGAPAHSPFVSHQRFDLW